MQLKSPRTSALDEVGNPDAPPGSRAWARYFVVRAKMRRHDMQSDAAALVGLMDKLAKHEAWLALGYASFEMLSQIEVELTPEELDRLRDAKPGASVEIALGQHGGNRKSEAVNDQPTNGRLIYGQTLRYLRARLDRDRPDILRRLDAGEFPSVRAAALEAGIVQPSFQCPADPLKASRRLLKHFMGDSLETLLRELANHAGFDLTPRG